MKRVDRSQSHHKGVSPSENKAVSRAVLVGSELTSAAAKTGIHSPGKAGEALRQHQVSQKIPHMNTVKKIEHLIKGRLRSR